MYVGELRNRDGVLKSLEVLTRVLKRARESSRVHVDELGSVGAFIVREFSRAYVSGMVAFYKLT